MRAPLASVFDILQVQALQLDYYPYLSIHVDLPHKISILTEDAGSGKTYMCRFLRTLCESPQEAPDWQKLRSTIPLEHIHVWETVHDVDRSVDNALIFIDRYDQFMLQHCQLDDEMLQSHNKFVLIKHTLKGRINVPLESVLCLHYDREKNLLYTEKYAKDHGFGKYVKQEAMDQLYAFAYSSSRGRRCVG